MAAVAAYLYRDHWTKMRAKAVAEIDKPKPVDESAAVGRTGLFDLKFNRRSALSDPKNGIARHSGEKSGGSRFLGGSTGLHLVAC